MTKPKKRPKRKQNTKQPMLSVYVLPHQWDWILERVAEREKEGIVTSRSHVVRQLIQDRINEEAKNEGNALSAR